MDAVPGAAEAAWGFAGIVASAIATQIGIAWRVKRQAIKKRDKDEELTRQGAEILLENKDNRAFQFLVSRLDAAEKAHRECEERADGMAAKFSRLGTNFDLAVFSLEILKGAIEQAGIKVPPLPAIERS